MSGQIRVDRDGPVTCIVLDAPDARNALTPKMLCQLADAIVAFDSDPAQQVLVITGAGERAFCAGGDLGRTLPLMTGDRAPEDEWDLRLLDDPLVLAASGLRDFEVKKPVIAAVNGACMAAGFELLLGTDIRLCAEHATFALPEVKRALIPFAGALARLPRQIPQCIAMELLLTGEPIGAAEAVRIGLVNRMLPVAELVPAALALAHKIAPGGPVAIREIKGTVLASSGTPLRTAFAIENEAKKRVMASADAREGPRAFMEKRAPVYRGR